jgi:hypothetical protein
VKQPGDVIPGRPDHGRAWRQVYANPNPMTPPNFESPADTPAA